jgi:hypothetical protein
MHAQQKSHRGNLRERAGFSLFEAFCEACSPAGSRLLFQSQTTVTNPRAVIGNEGIARSINSANVGTVHAPATY